MRLSELQIVASPRTVVCDKSLHTSWRSAVISAARLTVAFEAGFTSDAFRIRHRISGKFELRHGFSDFVMRYSSEALQVRT